MISIETMKLPPEWFRRNSIAVLADSRNPGNVGHGVNAYLVHPGFPVAMYGGISAGGKTGGKNTDSPGFSLTSPDPMYTVCVASGPVCAPSGPDSSPIFLPRRKFWRSSRIWFRPKTDGFPKTPSLLSANTIIANMQGPTVTTGR